MKRTGRLCEWLSGMHAVVQYYVPLPFLGKAAPSLEVVYLSTLWSKNALNVVSTYV